MQTTCWQTLRPLMIIGLLIGLTNAVQASDLKVGVHGMAWASHVRDHGHLIRLRAAGPVSYYVNRNMAYQAANQPVPGVVYGFFQDHFFAVYIKLRSPNQAYYLEKHFRTAYGPARVTGGRSGEQTVYRWKEEDVKVKLKINESNREIKLGIYYQPLSSQLNRMRAEEVPSGTFRMAPSDGDAKELSPLL